jgi:guanylate kinase
MSNNINPDNIVVVSGPSGSGKSTLIARLMASHPEIIFSVSHATRPIRGSEADGKEYYFVSEEQFKKMIEGDEFLEWALVYGNYYGTAYREIEDKTADEKAVLVLDVDVQGARNIKKKYPEALLVLITPPSLDELRNRLLGREQKIDEQIEKRLEIAKDELKQYNIYDYIVINDKLEDAFTDLNSIYIASRNTTLKREAFMKKKLLKMRR